MKIPNWLRRILRPLLKPQEPRREAVLVEGPPVPKKRKERKITPKSEEIDTFRPETLGEMRKRLGLGYGKVKVRKDLAGPAELPTISEGEGAELKRMECFWLSMNRRLKEDGSVKIGHNEHYGSLRGVDILIAAKRDFKRMGIPVEVQLCGSYGYIILKEDGPKKEVK